MNLADRGRGTGAARAQLREYADVHVALQVGRDPVGPVPGDAATAHWETEVRIVDGDFRG
ncbi:MAG: DUF5990 family protein, partial [Nocardioides sp.]